MKLTPLLIIFVLFTFTQVSAQEHKNKLSFEFGYGINSFKMGKFNEYYIDSFTTPILNLAHNKITSGEHFRFGLNYQPCGLFDFGVYGSYQYGNTTANMTIFDTDINGFPIAEHRGKYNFKTEAMGIGLNTTWYLSHILKFQNKENFLRNLHLGIELNGGIGFSNVIYDIRFPTTLFIGETDKFSSKDFQGQVGLKVEYDVTKSPLISTLGFRCGYQYFRTQTVKDRTGKEVSILGLYPINLDFSGFYVGAYIKIAN